MISNLVWSMVQVFKYKRIQCKKNKGLVHCNYRLAIETVHDITERPKDWTILLTFSYWSSYDPLMMSRPYIILPPRPTKR